MTIQILLIDAKSIVRDGVCAVALAHRHKPGVVLSDVLPPDLDGVRMTRRIGRELPETQVVILTSVSDQDQQWVNRAIRAGAIGYVMKSADVSELVQTIRHAAEGQVRLSSRPAASLVEEVQSPTHRIRLTEREQEVLREMAIGRTNKEIARSLNVALTTVKSHVRSILDKLGVESRTQAALHATRSQILSEVDWQAA
jgi:DNA-binding NarL/FixJ family response regulator